MCKFIINWRDVRALFGYFRSATLENCFCRLICRCNSFSLNSKSFFFRSFSHFSRLFSCFYYFLSNKYESVESAAHSQLSFDSEMDCVQVARRCTPSVARKIRCDHLRFTIFVNLLTSLSHCFFHTLFQSFIV